MIVFRYKKNTYPENSERLEIYNNSGLEAEVQFSFQHDTQAATYLLDPPTMTITPGQKEVLLHGNSFNSFNWTTWPNCTNVDIFSYHQMLTVWAFPTRQGQIKDSLVCHIKDNPEPVVIEFSCWGVRPELELESTNLNFGRILLHKYPNKRNHLLVSLHFPLEEPYKLKLGVSLTKDLHIRIRNVIYIYSWSMFKWSMCAGCAMDICIP